MLSVFLPSPASHLLQYGECSQDSSSLIFIQICPAFEMAPSETAQPVRREAQLSEITASFEGSMPVLAPFQRLKSPLLLHGTCSG